MKPRIYVSANHQEFATARSQVIQTMKLLGFDIAQTETTTVEADDLRTNIRHEIDASEGFIQLVGYSYGAAPPQADEDFGQVSYTQYEFLYAQKQGKKIWLLYPSDNCYRDNPVTDLDLPTEPNHPDPAGFQAKRSRWQQEHKLHLEPHLRRNYLTDDRLKLTLHDMRHEFDALLQQFQQKQEEKQRQLNRREWMLATAVTLIILLTVGLWWLNKKHEHAVNLPTAEPIPTNSQPVKAEEDDLTSELADIETNKDAETIESAID